MRIIIGIFLSALFAITAHAEDFTLKSSGFTDKGKIPESYTCDAGNVTPPLSWTNAPTKTQSFTLIFSSLDTPVGTFYNWVLYNIPSTTNGLVEGVRKLPEGTMVGKNSYGETIYRGPCPLDSLEHRYIITLYALDSQLDLSEGADVDDVLDAMNGHILKQTKLTGVFSH